MKSATILKGQILIAVVALITVGTVSVRAQEMGEITEKPEAVGAGVVTGWQGGLRLDGTFALGHTSHVPGSADGVSLQLGYLFNGDLGFLSGNGRHEWANALNMQLAFNRSAALEVFAKSVDTIDLRTAYLYHVPGAPWFGPYAAARMTTAMLGGYDVRSTATNVIRLGSFEAQDVDAAGVPLRADGTPLTAADYDSYGMNKRIPLTDAFAPLILRESAGVFAVPIDRPGIKFDARLGISAWETFAQGGYTLADNAATPDFLEVKQIEDTVQMGAEFAMIAGGTKDTLLAWGVSALFMQQFINNSDTKLKGTELMNMEFEAMLGVNVNNFISIVYNFKALKQPLVIEDWQIQNNLLVTVGFGFRRPVPPAPAEVPCACPACPTCEVCPAAVEAPAPVPAPEAAPVAEDIVAPSEAPEGAAPAAP